MKTIHKEEEQLLWVVLVVAGKLVIDFGNCDLEVSRADELVKARPQGLHDHSKLLRHLALVPQDVRPVVAVEEVR